MYLGDIYTISVNLAGLPGISLPCGLDSKGLPIGLQLIGDCFKEKKYHPGRLCLRENTGVEAVSFGCREGQGAVRRLDREGREEEP